MKPEIFIVVPIVAGVVLMTLLILTGFTKFSVSVYGRLINISYIAFITLTITSNILFLFIGSLKQNNFLVFASSILLLASLMNLRSLAKIVKFLKVIFAVFLFVVILGYLRSQSTIIVRGDNGKNQCLSGKFFTVYIHENLPRENWPAVHEAIDEWNRSLNIEVFRFGGYASEGNNTAQSLPDNEMLIVAAGRTDQRKYSKGAAAYEEGKIFLSYMNLGWRKKSMVLIDSTILSDRKHYPLEVIRSIFLHEFGHTLGINHPKHKNEIMSLEGTSVLTIQQGDVRAFSCAIDDL